MDWFEHHWVESEMLEERTTEIYIEEVDEKEMIHYVYAGDDLRQ